MFRWWSPEEQRVSMSNAAEDREAHPLLVHDDYATDGVDQVDDCEKPPEQYL